MATVPDPDPTQAFAKLKELFLLLDPEDASLSEEDQDRREELRQTFDYFMQCSRRISDYHHIHIPIGIKQSFSNIIPRFMQLLRESLLSHQWPEALKLVETLSKEMKGTDTAVWKAGLACLYQESERNRRLVEQFVKHLYVLKKLAVVEVMLDYLLYLLTQSEIEDAKLLVQELKQNTMFPSQLINENRKMAHKLFFAYQGLTLYAEWKLAIFKADQEDSETDFVSRMMSQGGSGQATRSIADSAVEYLVTVKDTPGVWDIFITRLVEIHEYYGNMEEARSTLQAYRDRNPTNPNAHRYLYEFESKHDGERDIQIQCLKDLVRVDPCNPLCLTLYHLLAADEPDAIHLLFDYLDYSHCVDSESVWEAMAAKLHEMDHNPELKDVVRSCWEVRKDWWPNMVFLNQSLSSQHDSSVPSLTLQNKRLVQKKLETLGT